MTPLAHEIATDSMLPVSRRKHNLLASEIGLFDNLHFFDVSAVVEAAWKMSDGVWRAFNAGHAPLTFLPASRVLLEYRIDGVEGLRRAAYLIEESGGGVAEVRSVTQFSGGEIRQSGVMVSLPLMDKADGSFVQREGIRTGEAASAIALHVYALLAMINTPRIINRRQHMPHAGLQRKLAAARGMVGKFPLLAWTEIQLEVAPPRDASGECVRRAYLTGAKAYHFCRSHLRVRLGQVELVSQHWRGDPSLGIKQSRYAVVPPRHGPYAQIGA